MSNPAHAEVVERSIKEVEGKLANAMRGGSNTERAWVEE